MAGNDDLNRRMSRVLRVAAGRGSPEEIFECETELAQARVQGKQLPPPGPERERVLDESAETLRLAGELRQATREAGLGPDPWDAGARKPPPSRGPSMNDHLRAVARAKRRARRTGEPYRVEKGDYDR